MEESQQPCDPEDAFTHDYGTGVEQPDGGRRWVCSKCGDVVEASGKFISRLEADRSRVLGEIAAREKEEVRALGSRIGYGNVMHRASQLWAETDTPGGHFLVGPCAAMTVACECAKDRHCPWCCGTGWITKQVALLRMAANGAYHHFNAAWIDDRKDGPIVRALGVALGYIKDEDA